MLSNTIKLVALLIIAILITALGYLLRDTLSFAQITALAEQMRVYTEENQLQSLFLFILGYYAACAIPFPFISVLTVLAGYLYGFLPALLITSFASTIGTSTLFLATRYIFRNWVRKNLIQRYPKLQLGADFNDFWIAFSLRLIPGMPLSVPSLALALTKLSLTQFYISSQTGFFITILVFVNAGSSLATINSISDVFSPRLIISMLLIAILPLAVKAIARKLALVRPNLPKV